MNYQDFLSNYANQDAQFYIDLAGGKCINMNGRPMFKAVYNLIISKRDFGLFAVGMKPHRYWKFNETKKYFGLTGNAQKVAEQVGQMLKCYEEFESEHVQYEEA